MKFVGFAARADAGVAHIFVETNLFVGVYNGHLVFDAFWARSKTFAASGEAVVVLVLAVVVISVVVETSLAVVVAVVVSALTVVSALRTVLAIGARLVLARLVGALCAAFGIAVVLAVIINTFVTRCASFGGAVSCRRGYMRDSGAVWASFQLRLPVVGSRC